MTYLNQRLATVVVALSIVFLADAAQAVDKYKVGVPLSQDDAIWLGGSKLAVVRHDSVETLMRQRALYVPGTVIVLDGKAAKEIRGVSGEDPTDILDRELVPVLEKQFAMAGSGSTLHVDTDKLQEIAGTPTDADYLLDLLPTHRRATAAKGFNSHYIVGYGVRVALIEKKSGRTIFASTCYSDTSDHPGQPRLDELAENDARLFQMVSDNLAWRCLQRIGNYLLPNPGAIPPPPRELRDPLAAYRSAHPL